MRIYYKKKFWAGVGALLLGLALTESCAIYGFVTALIIAFTLA